jgi:hypothetical protein
MKNLLIEVYKSPLTVFTLSDIALLTGESSENALKSKVNYYVKRNKLLAIRKGVYVKENYNRFELANKIYTPSYISLETVLQRDNIIFQHYDTIFAVSYLSREIKSLKIRYRKIKDSILSHPMGLVQEEGYASASGERAFLDALYIYGSYHFDNLSPLDQIKIFALIEEVYKIKKMEKQVKEIFKNA